MLIGGNRLESVVVGEQEYDVGTASLADSGGTNGLEKLSASQQTDVLPFGNPVPGAWPVLYESALFGCGPGAYSGDTPC